MEILTAILTSLGSIMGLTKNFFELRNTIKELFKKEIQLNKAFSDLSKKDEKVLTDLYKAIETGRELSNRLYKKLTLEYLITLTIFIMLFIGGIVFLQKIFPFKPIIILVGFLAGYILTTLAFPNPFKFNLKYLYEVVDETKKYANRIGSQIQLLYHPQIYTIRRVTVFLNWITPSENRYLQHYLDLCSLRDTLEIYWIDKKLEEAQNHIIDSLIFRPSIELSIAYIIEDTIKNNKDVLKSRDDIKNKIISAGLIKFLSIFGDGFFNIDFKDAYQKDSRNGVLNSIKQYWDKLNNTAGNTYDS